MAGERSVLVWDNQEPPKQRTSTEKILLECIELMRRKNSDYCHPDAKDTLYNFRQSSRLGLPAWIGVLTRMSDKWERIVTLTHKQYTNNEAPAVADESLEDTLKDIINYAAIALAMYREERKANSERIDNSSQWVDGKKDALDM